MNMINPDINLSNEAPVQEPERQYYYIEKAKRQLAEKVKEIGRPLTFCVTTFGCQMNARDSEKLVGILEQIGYIEETNEEKADMICKSSFNTEEYNVLFQKYTVDAMIKAKSQVRVFYH